MKLSRGRRRSRDSKAAAANREDRLSELPNDVLLNILERVGTLDALRTCILSKQMQKLPAMLSQIIIDLSNRDLIQMDGVVADVTKKILSARPPQITVRKLKLKFFLVPARCRAIGRSVGLAMATEKFDAAEFEIMTPRDTNHCTDAHRLLFAKQFNDFVCDCPDAFAGLTQLHLRNMRFGESDKPSILRHCRRLESLSFRECDAGFRSVLRVEHARLVEFAITYGEFKTVVLDCLPKLQRMSYRNWPCDENPLVLGFVPQLSKLSLANANISGKTLNLSQLLANAPTVSDLYLEFRSEKIWVQPECSKVLAPVLAELRFVNLDHLPEDCDISWTMFLLESAPYLEELCITEIIRNKYVGSNAISQIHWKPGDSHFWSGVMKAKEFFFQFGTFLVRDGAQKPEDRDIFMMASTRLERTAREVFYPHGWRHKNLGRLIIHGFQSDGNFTGYVRRVIQAAVNIREVSLHDRKVCQWCVEKFPHLRFRPSSYPRTREDADLLRKKMTAETATASPDIHFCS
ncbi:hypothetical protein CFC21_091760 [Triticum aestivum]|uniref:F-box domain-containing protein n=2 Tax=Triticum aestivum TaxID=4565 RepID=A0A9R1MTC6_WHEAT|nr:hypothetical protein CFC21_091760 [Triticum aestivum]